MANQQSNFMPVKYNNYKEVMNFVHFEFSFFFKKILESLAFMNCNSQKYSLRGTRIKTHTHMNIH